MRRTLRDGRKAGLAGALGLACILLAGPGAARAQDAPATPPAKPAGKVVSFPGIRAYPEQKLVEVDGRVCLQRGLIEVFACTQYGKVHEAVLILDCRPEHLQTGLLLLGMKETRGQIKNLGDGGILKGQRAIIDVDWTEDKKSVSFRAEDLLLDAHDGATMTRCGFAFTGSRFFKVGDREIFAANASGQIITTFHDPDAILDNPLQKGGDDTVYYANSKVLPAAGTRVTVHIRPESPAEAAARAKSQASGGARSAGGK